MKSDELRSGLLVTGLLSDPVRLTLAVTRANKSVYVCFKGHDGLTRGCVLNEEQVALLDAPSDLNPVRLHSQLVVESRLTIPLYHGTSSLFHASIQEHGLSGRNVIREFRVIELLGELVRIWEASFPIPKDCLISLDAARRIARQHVATGGMNFRHGTTYLSASRFTAANYSAGAGKEFGSEAIEYFMRLYRHIAEVRPALLTPLAGAMAPLLGFISRKTVPLLIEARSVPVASLRTEHGEAPDAAFDALDKLLNEDMEYEAFERMAQQRNFELVSALSSDHLVVHQVLNFGPGELRLAPFTPD